MSVTEYNSPSLDSLVSTCLDGVSLSILAQVILFLGMPPKGYSCTSATL